EIHGFDLIEPLKIKSGTLYPLLIRLENLGWLESRWEESNRPGPRRRLYRLTAEGEPAARRFLAEAKAGKAAAAVRQPRVTVPGVAG
ncbi:MAG TPA: helix-turn-helix transcriptional regulator, partial [Solirubrobacterales bacterium]|nr:helix-turn-helix transcriptional regulator [Solirubrobacterales bacterium]